VHLGHYFSFLIYTQSVGLLGRVFSTPQCRYLHTEQHKHKIKPHRHSYLEWDSNLRPQCSSGEEFSCLRTRGYCDRPEYDYYCININLI
jgi:hypothetical protein